MTDLGPSAIPELTARIAPGWSTELEVGPGWSDLLTRLNRDLAAIAPEYVIEQCKSKFGGLRFYARASEDNLNPFEFDERIRDAEAESEAICEECGSPAAPVTVRGWVWTLCNRHAAQRGSDSAAS